MASSSRPSEFQRDNKEAEHQHKVIHAGRQRKPTPSVKAPAAWSYLNKLYPDNNDANTPFAPAVTQWEGSLICLWSDVNNVPFFAGASNAKGSWSHRNQVSSGLRMSDGGAVAVFGEATQNLHFVIKEGGTLRHVRYTNQNGKWLWVGPKIFGASANHQPALIGFNNQLACAFTSGGNNQLYLCFWDPPAPGDYVSLGTWSDPIPLGALSWGVPALYVIDETLHLTFAANNTTRTLIDMVYDPPSKSLKNGFGFDQIEASAFGCSATSFDETAFLAFQQNDGSGGVLVCQLDNDRKIWARNDATGQRSKDTPCITVLDTTVNCIFNAHYDTEGNLLQIQRPATTYPAGSWISHTPDAALWTDLSIPGTHDSMAYISLPFAQTQTMTLKQQLDNGVRSVPRSRLSEFMAYTLQVL